MKEARRPYVRYTISAEITDKGVGYAAKKAINTFLQTHGFEGHVTDLEASSDKFQAVLELYDNGKYDFNVRALNEHLEASGRLPTKEALRPKIIIKPLDCTSNIQVNQNAPEALAYQKAIEAFQKQLAEKDEEVKKREGTIKSLNDILKERQVAIDEGSKKISVLEQRVAEASPRQYANAKDAIINGYLKDATETYMDLSLDIQELANSENLKLFAEFGGHSEIFFAKYLNLAYNTNFQSDSEVESWEERMGKLDSWKDTDEARKLEETARHYQADSEVLQLAEQRGASTEVLEVLRGKIEESRGKISGLETEMKTIQEQFEKDKKVFTVLDKARARYQKFAQITEHAIERRKKGTQLPVVMEILEYQPGITFYTPYEDHNCALGKLMRKRLDDKMIELMTQGIDLKNPHRPKGSLLSLVSQAEISIGEISMLGWKTAKEIQKDTLLRALGVTTRITRIIDNKAIPLPNLEDSKASIKNN